MLPNDPPTFPFRWDSRLPSACGLSPISHLHLASAAFRDATSGRLDHYPRLIREPIAASGIPPAAHHPPEESQRRRWRKPLFNEAMHALQKLAEFRLLAREPARRNAGRRFPQQLQAELVLQSGDPWLE